MRYLFLLLLAVGCASCTSPSKPIAAIPPAHAGPVIARMVGRHDTIVIRAGDSGPTYSLQTARGEVLVPDITLGTLAITRPEFARRINRYQDSVMYAGIGE